MSFKEPELNTLTNVKRLSRDQVGPPLTEEEQEMLLRTRQLVDTEIGPRAMDVNSKNEFPWENFRLLSESGIIGTAFPREYGGSAARMQLRVRIVEEIARVCSSSSILVIGADTSCRPIISAGSEYLKKTFGQPLARGKIQVAFAVTERGAGSDLAGLSTTVRRDGDSYVINGIKRYISRAPDSQLFIVVGRLTETRGAGGLCAFLVDRDTPGLTVGPEQEKMGLSGIPTSEVFLNDVRVPANRLLGDEGKGFAIAQDSLIRARIAHAAAALGRSQGALEMAVQYASWRRVGGKLLGEHQGVQWMLADMGIKVETMRCLVRSCAARYDAEDPEIMVHASMAKTYATDACMQVVSDALQLWGGNGYVKEFPLERIFRDSRVNQIAEGPNEVHRTVIGRHMVRNAGQWTNPSIDLERIPT